MKSNNKLDFESAPMFPKIRAFLFIIPLLKLVLLVVDRLKKKKEETRLQEEGSLKLTQPSSFFFRWPKHTEAQDKEY